MEGFRLGRLGTVGIAVDKLLHHELQAAAVWLMACHFPQHFRVIMQVKVEIADLGIHHGGFRFASEP